MLAELMNRTTGDKFTILKYNKKREMYVCLSNNLVFSCKIEALAGILERWKYNNGDDVLITNKIPPNTRYEVELIHLIYD